MYAHELYEQNKPRVVVTYPGRFQPFHQGHAGVFAQLQKKFGRDSVYILTSNDTSSAKSPFNFSDKYQLMTAAGVPGDKIIETNQMYKLPDSIDAANTIFITAVGAPDADRLNPDTYTKRDQKDKEGNVTKPAGSPSYYKTWGGPETPVTSDQHGYVIIIPEIHKEVTIKGKKYDVSHGTECRNLWNAIRNDAKARTEFLTQMYARPSQELAAIFDKIPQATAEDISADSQTSTSPIHGGQVTKGMVESDLQEIQRTKGDEEGLSTKGQNWGKETLAKIKMLPGSQRFGYTAGDAGRASSFLTDADTIIELFDIKHPQDGLRKAGFLSLRSAPWFPIKNSYQVANVGLDSEYRGQGLGQNLYGVAMKLLGMTIVADDTQTPQARSSWLRLSQVPGVAINGYTSVFPDEWALRNNRNEIYDDSAKRLISSLLKAGAQEIGKKSGFVYVSFPVGANADQNELQALQKGMSIYSSRHPEDGGTQNGLYARWGGQVNEQGVAEGDNRSSAKTGIYQSEVYGTKAYHSKCLEKGCDWESRRFDRIKQAQDAAKKHAQTHIKSGVAEDAAGVGVVAKNKKMAKDPRYSMSITKDVKPSTPKNMLRAFRLSEDSAVSEEQIKGMVKSFLPLAMKELKLKKLPKIIIKKHIESHDGQATFGRFANEEEVIYLGIADRHPVDILRTLAHELVHSKQHEQGRMEPNSGDTGSPIENEANAVAGVLMRYFNKKYPDAVKSSAVSLDESLFERYQQFKENGDEADEIKKQKNLILYPKGTVKVDVSDVYDWYKLGQEISDLDDANPADFGKGPPQTVMAFGSEPEEHRYLKDLKKLGLKTHDIDENFADGRNPQDKGDSKRYNVPTKGKISTLRKIAKQGGRRGQLAHWMANMRSGKNKK